MTNLTEEQLAVVDHPDNSHAKILAVAGSGKTSTLVYRIKSLVENRQVNPASIRVLMFNRYARDQFIKKMGEENIPTTLQPRVNTFHSFSYGFVQDLMASGRIANDWDFWTDDREEKARFALHRAISKLERANRIPEDSVDADEAYQAIQLWKGSLIPPDRAGYKGNDYMPRVYEAYEMERMDAHALAYDDFIPIVVSYLEHNPDLLNQYAGRLRYLIVDEYQDVNFGQQRLIELLAGHKADVMVVGDDDQTIFEWRGARPNYIIREFQSVFSNKPLAHYTLSRTFRFGPVIAQCAYNSILFNTNRVSKNLVSYKVEKQADIFIYQQKTENDSDTNKMLADQVLTLVKTKDVPPKEIKVLCRMFAQLCGIESEFMARRIPYRVDGQKPFFQRREATVLLDYIRVSDCYREPVTEKTKAIFLSIANTPNRMLSRRNLEQLMSGAYIRKRSIFQALEEFVESPESPLDGRLRERVIELMSALERAHKQINKFPLVPAHIILAQLVDDIDYFAHFENYYGKGETSFDRKESVLNFIEYAKGTQLPAIEFLEHIARLDTTRGVPEDQQIAMTTVFKTKGMEYDYVVIPNCDEGYMPCLYATDNQIYDKSGQIREPEPSESIENERRLFYVALTRAKEAVYIGTKGIRAEATSGKSSRFLEEIQFEPTHKMMAALQQTAAGEKGAKTNLISLVKQFGGIKSLVQNLLSHYLVALADPSLAAEVSSIVRASPEMSFRYQYPYSAAQGPSFSKKQHMLHSAWDEVGE